MFEKLQQKKVNVSINLNENLLARLNKYKKDNKIKLLSPMIDAMLEDWLNKQEGVAA